MPVICEAISVVIKRDAVDQHYRGGWEQFSKIIPNGTMCTDGELVRIGFMAPQHAQEFIGVLETGGLQFLPKKKFMGIFGRSRPQNDIVVVDQNQGPTMLCEWIDFAKFRMSEDGGLTYIGPRTENLSDEKNIISFAWMRGKKSPYKSIDSIQFSDGQLQNFATPNNWSLDDAMTLEFHSENNIGSRLQYLRTEDTLDVFWDQVEGKEVFTPSRDT